MDTLPLGFQEPADLYLASTADRIARGVCRRLGEMGYRTLLEFRVGIGRRADVAGLDATGRFVIVEIKSSTADFRSDAKW
ncbi:MAG: MmcB family DNA repair protein, partial [Rhodospirillaceae bacterium]|nr:MmcB family DNA repair protein [Rhodospirillaceae bacterium]